MGPPAVLVALCGLCALAALTAGEHDLEPSGCRWKPCEADQGPRCYRVHESDAYVTAWCPDGTLYNPLVCAAHDAHDDNDAHDAHDAHDDSHVCITEDELVQEAADLKSVYNTSAACSGDGWKGSMGHHCFKRFSNRMLMTCEQCNVNCATNLHQAEIAELNSIAKNVYIRGLGVNTNQYWVGLRPNAAGDGWEWINDGSPLTEDQAMFPTSLADTIEELKAANGGVIPESHSCVVQTAGSLEVSGVDHALPFVWSVVSCDTQTQCMCQSDAKLEMCPWKACAAEAGAGCYKARVRGEWRPRACPGEGQVFNTLICADEEVSHVCVTPAELAAKAAWLHGQIDASHVCQGKSWKGPIGGVCYKRFGNSNYHDFDQCKYACSNDLHIQTAMAEMTTVAQNVFVRQVGHIYNSYWVGLQLNSAGDGWTWVSTGEPLTDAQARFGRPVADEIAALRQRLGDVIPPAAACVTSQDGSYSDAALGGGALPFRWAVTGCRSRIQCLCQKAAEEE